MAKPNKRTEETTAPTTPVSAPAAVTEEKAKSKRGHLSDDAKAKGRESRHMRTAVNDYLLSLKKEPSGKRSETRETRIAEIDAILAKGTFNKAIPQFTIIDGAKEGDKKTRKRSGTVREDRPLDPIKIAELTAERSRLSAIPVPRKQGALRAEVIAFLPEFCARNKFDRNALLAAGFPVADLDEAGIK